jgi:brefeldin A-resistance guanine nucleotide exchange factor 1
VRTPRAPWVDNLRFADTLRGVPPSTLKYIVDALLAQLPDDQSATIISVKTETSPSVTADGQSRASNGPIYDPVILYLLELSTILALRDEETITNVGQDVAEALQGIVRDSAHLHSIVVSRTAYYLLNILSLSYVSLKDMLYPT